jgi:hypothetical protein
MSKDSGVFAEEFLQNQKDLNTVSGLSNCTAFLKASIGWDGRDGSVSLVESYDEEILWEVQLPASSDTLLFGLAGKSIGLWLIPDEDAKQWGCLCFLPSDQFSFAEDYTLPDTAGVLTNQTFWNGGWMLFCDQESYAIPQTFTAALGKTASFGSLKLGLDNNAMVLSSGLNLVHKWNLAEALETFNVGVFADLLDQTDLTLLANESPGGMVFTILAELQTFDLPPYLNKFLGLEWVTFSIYHSFADEVFPQRSASLSAQVKFLDQDALLEVTLPMQSQTEAVLSMEIYPQSPHALAGGLSQLCENLGIATPAFPESVPGADLEMDYLRLGITSDGIDRISTAINFKAGTDDNGWSIPKDPELFTFYGVTINLDWQKEGDINFTLEGAMNALSYDFLLSYAYPAQAISAKVAPGVTTEKSIETLATELGLPEGLAHGLAEVGTAFEISITADIDDREFELRLQNHHAWKLAGFIEVSTLDLRLEFLDQWRFSGASLHVELDLPIGQKENEDSERELVTIDIEAGYEKNENVWTFEGETGDGQGIAVGEAINALVTKVGGSGLELPDAIQSLVVTNIHLLFDNKGNAEFTCTTSLDIEGKELDFWIHLKREQSGTFLISGSLFMNGIQLGVAFESKSGDSDSEGDSDTISNKQSDKYLVGSLLAPLTLDSKDLISAIAPDLAPDIPLSVELQLKGLLLGLHKGSTPAAEDSGKPDAHAKSSDNSAGNEFLFRLDFNLDVDLGGIPLIGAMLPDGIGFTNGQLLAANKDWKDTDIEEVNSLLDQFQPNQPEAISILGDNGPAVRKGISLGGSFRVTEDMHFPMFLHFGGTKQNESADEPHSASNEISSGSAHPSESKQETKTSTAVSKDSTEKNISPKPGQGSKQQVGKHLGPVNVKSAELIFQDGRLGLKLTGGLSMAAFEFELIGLSVTVPQTVLKDPSKVTDIAFGLDGIGIDIQKGTLTIAGAFLRLHYPESTTEDGHIIAAYDEYNGVVQVAFPPFSLTGMGSYAMYDGHPSLFLFVAIGFPITLSPAFVLEGMSLGFGIHRNFIAPEMHDILSFPLIQASVTPPPPIDINKMVESLHDYFPPTVDQYFIVAGIKFKAFGMVDTLALVAVKFGREFEIDLIGVSSILLPGGFIELAWMARIMPEKGEIFIGGELTERSYILVPMAQLTGGFAVAFWTGDEHKGDFVVSVGGYHPLFKKPDHYPDHIPRLGIRFNLGDIFTIKGGLYFAITPQAVMLGGFLDATLKMDNLEGYLKMNFDVLIWYQPFHYDAVIGVDAGVKIDIPLVLYTEHIDTQLHLDVHIWGPDFAGIAYIDVVVKTFSIPFGDQSSSKALPVSWQEFGEKFLGFQPESHAEVSSHDTNENTTVCSVVITKGLLRRVKLSDGTEVCVVNAKELEIEAKTIIPITKYNGGANDAGAVPKFGVTPMGIPGDGYTAGFDLILSQESEKFSKTPIYSSVPSAIWGTEGFVQADLSKSDDALLKNALTGFRISPGSGVASFETHEMDKEKLAYNTDDFKIHGVSSMYFFKNDVPADVLHGPMDSFSDFTGIAFHDLMPIDVSQFLYSPTIVSLTN